MVVNRMTIFKEIMKTMERYRKKVIFFEDPNTDLSSLKVSLEHPP